ncbi:hypothetical protein [Microbulbifer aggregans]|uniref:hypothetical protein n=1 Tax=Microbulbifer aggregans TaxID=1769779 RepID=UPI001CFF2233|nr:hypothetical protein [Microbulbifer aggregans]
MNIYKVVFWLLLFWVLATIALRIYWFKKERYGYASWFFEWLLACFSCAGVYVVAFNQPFLKQTFWWFVLLVVVVSSVYRLQSQRFKQQVEQLSLKQFLFIKMLMALFTLPVAIILFINASNYTGVWGT